MKKQEQLKKQVLDFLAKHPDKIYKPKELAKILHIPNARYQSFKLLIRTLSQQGEISRYKGNKFGSYQTSVTIEGKLHVKTQGYGFVIREDDEQDIFISQKNMGDALHGDQVRVELWAKSAGRSPEGRVLQVVNRGRTKIVGIFQEATNFCYVMPDDLKITTDIYVDNKDRLDAKIGQKVVVEIDDWGDGRKMPVGHVAQVLGYSSDKGVDVLSVAFEFDLPLEFPEVVLKAANSIQQKNRDLDLSHRLDLRHEFIITIDPEDAKDYDDAISLIQLENGNLKLGVHIADVSHFVQPDSVIDREALKRSTSVYLVDRVIPMLPEALSNQICSLQPNEDHLTFSVFMELTPSGDLIDYHIQESVIHSQFRLTYQQAQAMIDSDPEKKKALNCPDHAHLSETLKSMASLSQILHGKWKKQGTIDFEVPEPKVVLNDEGIPVELSARERLWSHRMIEAFMLMANRTVAEHVKHVRKAHEKKLSFVYRIHEKPSGKKLDDFANLLKALGHGYDTRKKMTPKKMQSILASFSETPHKIIVETLALRSMMKAQYSTHNQGHFGLAFNDYTHFTSPIRRYPDLIVHRLIKKYLREDPQTPKYQKTLSTMCEIANEREIIAMEAERESVKAKQMEFMQEKLGEIYDGIISGVTSFGIFVEIPEYLVEGLVHIKDLDDDYYEFDERHYRLTGQRGRNQYCLGDPCRIQVARVLMDMRKLDFVLAKD